MVAQAGIHGGIDIRDQDDFGTTGTHLLNIGDHLRIDVRLGGKSNHGNIIGDQGDRPVFEFPGGVGFGVNVTNLF